MEYVYILIAVIGLTNNPVELATFGDEEACKKVAIELSKEDSFAAVRGEEMRARTDAYICLKSPDGAE